jgi:hypothetical protein
MLFPSIRVPAVAVAVIAVAVTPRRQLPLKLRRYQSPLVAALRAYHDRLAIHPRAHR